MSREQHLQERYEASQPERHDGLRVGVGIGSSLGLRVVLPIDALIYTSERVDVSYLGPGWAWAVATAAGVAGVVQSIPCFGRLDQAQQAASSMEPIRVQE